MVAEALSQLGGPKPIETLTSHSVSVNAALAAGLSKEASLRPSSALALIEAFTTGDGRRPAAPARRNRLAVVASLLVALGVLICGIILIADQPSPAPYRPPRRRPAETPGVKPLFKFIYIFGGNGL